MMEQDQNGVTPTPPGRVPDRTGPTIRRVVEAGALVKFARATGQTDPVYLGEAADHVAPPTYVGTFCNETLAGVYLPRPEHDMVLHTADKVTQFAPIRPGDILTAQARLDRVEERVGRFGPTTVQRATIAVAGADGRPVATIEVEMRSFRTEGADD